jgi:nitroreductase
MKLGMSAFDDLVRSRRSVRGFTEREVPTELIREALELAQHSPSNCNAQPWRVFVARGEPKDRLKQRLVAAFAANRPAEENPTPQFRAAHRQRQIACAVELYDKMGVARGDQAARRRAALRNYEFFDAPHVAIVCMDRSFGVGVALDVGCWLETFLLALWSRGISACPQAALRAYGEIVKEELGIAPELLVLCGVSFGYEDASVPANRARMPRVPVDDCVSFLGFE